MNNETSWHLIGYAINLDANIAKLEARRKELANLRTTLTHCIEFVVIIAILTLALAVWVILPH